jgi:organic radical activating enzyme
MKLHGTKIIEIKNESDMITIDWTLGNFCNFKCGYCFDDCNSGTIRPPKINDTVKNNIQHLINQIRKNNDKSIIFNFGGGEPTLFHDFENLINFCSTLGKISMVTNGSRTINWWNDNKKFINFISLSFHVEETNFDHVVNLIKEIGNDVSISVHFIIDDLHFDKSTNLYEQLRNIIIEQKLKTNLYIKTLRSTSKRKISYDKDQSKIINSLLPYSINPPVFKTLIKLENGKTVGWDMRNLINYSENFFNYTCEGHKEFVQIFLNGDVGMMSCGQFYLNNMTNIFSNDFSKNFIVNDEKLICKQLRDCGCLGLHTASKFIN